MLSPSPCSRGRTPPCFVIASSTRRSCCSIATRHRLGFGVPPRSRRLDVGEQEGDRAGRQVGHRGHVVHGAKDRIDAPGQPPPSGGGCAPPARRTIAWRSNVDRIQTGGDAHEEDQGGCSGQHSGCSPVSAVSAQPHTNVRRATTAAALTALLALSACGSDGSTASGSSTPLPTPVESEPSPTINRQRRRNRRRRHNRPQPRTLGYRTHRRTVGPSPPPATKAMRERRSCSQTTSETAGRTTAQTARFP